MKGRFEVCTAPPFSLPLSASHLQVMPHCVMYLIHTLPEPPLTCKCRIAFCTFSSDSLPMKSR